MGNRIDSKIIFIMLVTTKSHNLIPTFWKQQRVNLNRPRHGDGEAKYIKILGNKRIIAGTVMAPHNFSAT